MTNSVESPGSLDNYIDQQYPGLDHKTSEALHHYSQELVRFRVSLVAETGGEVEDLHEVRTSDQREQLSA